MQHVKCAHAVRMRIVTSNLRPKTRTYDLRPTRTAYLRPRTYRRLTRSRLRGEKRLKEGGGKRGKGKNEKRKEKKGEKMGKGGGKKEKKKEGPK